MNWKQKICLWVGIALVVLMGLFPPYQYKPSVGVLDMGYHFLLYSDTIGEINIKHLAVQWIIVAVITGGLIATFQGSENSKRRPSRHIASSIITVPTSTRGRKLGWKTQAFIDIICIVFGVIIAAAIFFYISWEENPPMWEVLLRCVLPGLAGFLILYLLIDLLLYLIKRR